MQDDRSRYIFCVDTDSYAGNFERELCAYMTGVVGDCGVGEEGVECYTEDGHKPLEDLVDRWVPDEKGCSRPVTLMASPGWFNDGLGGHYREADYDLAEVIKNRNEEVEDYAKNTIEKVYADKDYAKKEADRYRKENTIASGGVIPKYPAYNSVGIFLSRRPTKEEFEFLKVRATKYMSDKRKKSRFSGDHDEMCQFKIEGFRLVVKRVVYEEEQL